MFSKIRLIFNPASGQGFPLPFLSRYHFGIKQYNFNLMGKPEKVLQVLQAELHTVGLHTDAVIANSNEHCEQLARESVHEGYDCLIAAGGDGTVNAIINGLAESDVSLGLLPMGSMNILANQMNIPRTLRRACQVIAQGHSQCIDLGMMNDRYFSCMAGIGFDAYIIRRTDYATKRLMGAIAYGVSALISFFTFPFKHIHFRTETGEEFYGHTIIVGNVKYYGGDMILLPAAELNDGKLDVILFKKKTFFALLVYGLRVMFGSHHQYPDINYLQVTNLEILHPEKQHVHIDGDYFGKMTIHIKIIPQALKLLTEVPRL